MRQKCPDYCVFDEFRERRDGFFRCGGRDNPCLNGGQPPVVAVIFDMDGVLIDSNPTHAAAWIEYLSGLDLPYEGIDTWMAGKRNDQIMRILLGDTATDGEIFAHGAAKEALYRQMMEPNIEERLMPGLRPFLDTLASLPLGLGSNAEPANIEFLLDKARLRGKFRAVVDGHQVERPKPAPDIYLRVAQLMDVDPRECVIFEDSPSGIRAARAAGAKVVGVDRGGRQLDGTDLSIRDFADPALAVWLGRAREATGG